MKLTDVYSILIL